MSANIKSPLTNEKEDRRIIKDFLLILDGTDTGSLIKHAEEAMNGMLVLNGTGPEPVFVGIPPRWEDNPCGVGGYTWTMSRLTYMVTLCKAYLLTKEQRYLDKVEADLANWFETVPAPPIPHDYESACYYHGIHNWRMLELGYRMVYTFPILLSVIRTFGSSKKLVDRICLSIAEHAERISAGSHLLWPGQDHNHYTEEINGLLSAASMLPDDPRTPAWIEQAMDGLEHACASQITEDGSQTEGSGEYHSAVTINFCHSIFLAKKCGRIFSSDFVSRVKKAIDFSIHTLGPDGNMLPFGDSDALLYTPVDAAILSYLLFNDTKQLVTLRQFIDVKFIFQQLSERFPWGFPGIPQLYDTLKAPIPPADCELLPTITYQRQMDQYIIRSDWSKNAACLFFSSNSPIHPGSNHAHMDQLGIIYGAYGKILLQDPGRYTYKDCEDRHLYKSSQVHSVPTVDGRDAFAYLGTFAYGPQEDGSLTAIMNSERITGAYGYHNNYHPVTISRSAALLDKKLLLIADTFQNIRGQGMKVFFHFNSAKVEREGTSFVTRDPGTNLRIHSNLPEGEIQTEILDGRLSDVFYHDYPSRRGVYSRIASGDTETLFFVCVPFRDAAQDNLKDFVCENGIISFICGGESYRLVYKDGIFII